MTGVGIVGAGTMGVGVAQCAAEAGHQVVVVDSDPAALAAGPVRLRDGIRMSRLLGRTPLEPKGAAERVRWVRDPAELHEAGFVVECVRERIPVKEAVLRRLDEVCPPETVFASCTSAVPITLLASYTNRPDRVIGTHFMNPAPLKDAVEVIRSPLTGAETLRRTTELLGTMGKEAIVVGDAPGFVSNRVLMATVNDAARVVQEGTADAAAVDRIFQECFGHAMGPLRTADLIGLDTVVDSLHVLLECTGDKGFEPCELLAELVAEGRTGRKSGRGFHTYRTIQAGNPVPLHNLSRGA
ncbi:3-hydroxyacyl-CoA dehydrogenase family protein [Nonomuraea mangrovi]|uniref:3-hydroxyacyl-CoA dehydrogenase family protein n=1 Tax=Nonomuraea mangrovi TaxID=2316207 RepID=A0ABW4T364_9ACTN